jgi:hypothetical protein
MTNQRSGGAINLIRWCSFPTTPTELFAILDDTTEDELVLVMQSVKGAAGRLAWAAYGKKRGFFDFDIGISTGHGKTHIDFMAPGLPVTDLPQYQ